MSAFSIRRLCTPASIYFWLAIISLFISYLGNRKLISSLISLIFIFMWTWILNMLCSKGYRFISWFLVLLPFISLAFIILKMNYRTSF